MITNKCGACVWHLARLYIKRGVIRNIVMDPESRQAFYDIVAIYRRCEKLFEGPLIKYNKGKYPLLKYLKKKQKIYENDECLQTIRLYVKIKSLERYAGPETLLDLAQHPMYKVLYLLSLFCI